MNKIDLDSYEVIELSAHEETIIEGGSILILVFFFLLGVGIGYGAASDDGV